MVDGKARTDDDDTQGRDRLRWIQSAETRPAVQQSSGQSTHDAASLGAYA